MKDEGFCDAIGLGAGDVDVMMPLLRDWDFDVDASPTTASPSSTATPKR